MKLGKKALSCLLAIMMIVTSVSVCSTVFGADGTNQLNALANQIVMNWDGLSTAARAFEAKKTSDTAARVPILSSVNSNAVVKVDTYLGGWNAVAQAYAAYVDQVASTAPTSGTITYNEESYNVQSFEGLYNYAIAKMPANLGLTSANYAEILTFFRFNRNAAGETATPSTSSFKLTVEPNFDITMFPTVAAIDASKAYKNATVTFSFGSSKITGASYTSSEATYTEDVENIKTVLESLINTSGQDNFKYWLNTWANQTHTDEEYRQMATADGKAGKLFGFFNERVNSFTGNAFFPDDLEANNSSKAEVLWDHFVAPTVGKSYDETYEWINEDLLEAAHKGYANEHITAIDTLLAEDTSDYAGWQLKDYYNRLVAEKTALDGQLDFNQANCSAEVKALIVSGDPFKDADYLEKFDAAIAKAKVNVGKKYASEYGDNFDLLLKYLVPAYDHSVDSDADKWEASAYYPTDVNVEGVKYQIINGSQTNDAGMQRVIEQLDTTDITVGDTARRGCDRCFRRQRW